MATKNIALMIFSSVPLISAQMDSNLAEKTEREVTKIHTIDSLNILMFISLLILTVLTIWMFKHRRFRFVHETGLAIIYGLIVGAIIRYGSQGQEVTTDTVVLPSNSTYSVGSPPDTLKLSMSNRDKNNHTSTVLFRYNYEGKVLSSNTGNSQLEQRATFDPEVFFNVLLPPIIFYAGYSMKRKHFFKNFGAIVMYAFMGTVVSCFVVGAVLFGLTRWLPGIPTNFGFNNCLFFGALISATDPVTVLAIFSDLNVDVDLYALVFGESVLNDAVAIVLSGAIDNYGIESKTPEGVDKMAVLKSLGNFAKIFCGAFALGSGMGMVTAILTKYTKIRDYPLLETTLFFLMSYGTFLAAEAADLTGIVAVLFCGICQAHYTYNNLSTESKARTKQLFELLNFLAENFVFTYIGVSTLTFQKHLWNVGFIFTALLAVVIARSLTIYPLTFLLNLGRSNKIRFNFQHMMVFAGLRGAIAFALAIRNTNSPERQLIFSTTLIVVIITVIVCGGLTTQMLQLLKIRVGVDDDAEAQNFEPVRTQSPSEPSPPGPHVDTRTTSGKAWLVLKWYNFDAKFMKPLLTHAKPPLTETLPRCCLPLAKLLTTDEQRTQDHRSREDSDVDLIIDDQELSYGDHNSITSISGSTDPGRRGILQIDEDAALGDLGLGDDGQPIHTTQTRVRIPGAQSGQQV